MDLGKIEIKTLDEIYAGCRICRKGGRKGEPNLHYYVVKKERKYKTFGDCLVDQRAKLKAYVDYKGIGDQKKKEFLSATNVRTIANKVWKADGYPMEILSFACETLVPNKAVDALIADENFKGFAI